MKTINNKITQEDIDLLYDRLTYLEMLFEFDKSEKIKKEIEEIEKKIKDIIG
jgi:hypothetical protein